MALVDENHGISASEGILVSSSVTKRVCQAPRSQETCSGSVAQKRLELVSLFPCFPHCLLTEEAVFLGS